jgi:hypothetical protein
MEVERKDGLLKAKKIRKLHTPPDDRDYVCGWQVLQRGWAGGRALTHSGSNTMWYLVMWLAPKKISLSSLPQISARIMRPRLAMT